MKFQENSSTTSSVVKLHSQNFISPRNFQQTRNSNIIRSLRKPNQRKITVKTKRNKHSRVGKCLSVDRK